MTNRDRPMTDTERLDRLEGWLRRGWRHWPSSRGSTLSSPGTAPRWNGKHYTAPTLREAIDLAAEACDE